ncbi:MAG: nucleotidyltransferase domain-containing protein [Muribaculaceae bacterium]|nr:nucleotidyltransferase domain-containing protein [Muribaculaceae bacterium]
MFNPYEYLRKFINFVAEILCFLCFMRGVERIKGILAKIRELLFFEEPEVKVILYGSYARGEAREDSDIDLLILLPDRYEGREFVKKKFAISDKLYDLSLESGMEISPMITVSKIFKARKTLFSVNINNEGLVVI